MAAYQEFADRPGFSAVVTTDQVLAAEGNLSIPRYLKKPKPEMPMGEAGAVAIDWIAFDAESRDFWIGMDALMDMVDGLAAVEDDGA